MSSTTDYIIEREYQRATAKALGLTPEYLEQYHYEVDESGNIIIWLETPPEEVKTRLQNGQLVTDFEFEPEPDEPDYE